MPTRWKSLSRLSRWSMAANLLLGATSTAVIFTDAALPALCAVSIIWLATNAYTTLRVDWQLSKTLSHLRRVNKVFGPDGSNQIHDLSPEDQEELHIAWAKATLNHKHHD